MSALVQPPQRSAVALGRERPFPARRVVVRLVAVLQPGQQRVAPRQPVSEIVDVVDLVRGRLELTRPLLAAATHVLQTAGGPLRRRHDREERTNAVLDVSPVGAVARGPVPSVRLRLDRGPVHGHAGDRSAHCGNPRSNGVGRRRVPTLGCARLAVEEAVGDVAVDRRVKRIGLRGVRRQLSESVRVLGRAEDQHIARGRRRRRRSRCRLRRWRRAGEQPHQAAPGRIRRASARQERRRHYGNEKRPPDSPHRRELYLPVAGMSTENDRLQTHLPSAAHGCAGCNGRPAHR